MSIFEIELDLIGLHQPEFWVTEVSWRWWWADECEVLSPLCGQCVLTEKTSYWRMTPRVQLSWSLSLVSSSAFLPSSRICVVKFLNSPSCSDLTALTGTRQKLFLFLLPFYGRAPSKLADLRRLLSIMMTVTRMAQMIPKVAASPQIRGWRSPSLFSEGFSKCTNGVL